jgi:hypothetical protein
MTACKNCDYNFEGKFCTNCSQKADTHRFTLLHFGHDFIHALTHTDKGVIFLMRELIKRPGYVAREYNSGKRKKYFNPITFLLIMTAAQVFTASKTGFFTEFASATQQLVKETFMNDKYTDEELRDFNAKNDQTAGVAKVSDNGKLLTLLFIPMLSLLTWIFFKKSGHNYAENLILNVLILGQLMLLFIPFAAIPFLIAPSYVILWFSLYFVINILYSLVAYKQFFGQGWGWTIFKGISLQFIYLIVGQMLTNLIFNTIY